ncbi:MAG: hypothetical protein KGI27_00565 [Thaumarchaeota archaeon]|nr:hypothetical protein [Nitrososphaerota archaeon]
MDKTKNCPAKAAACIASIFLISVAVLPASASVNFDGYMPIAGGPVTPSYDFEKSFYIDYPAGSKLQDILEGKNATISFVGNADNNPDIKTLMHQINSDMTANEHSSVILTNLAVNYQLTVTGYHDHASFDYRIVLVPTVTGYVLNKASGNVPETLDASWVAFNLNNPVTINTKQYGPLEINYPIDAIQSQMPDVYDAIKDTAAEHVFKSENLIDASELYSAQPLDKWDSLFDPAYTLTGTAGYGYQGQKIAVTTFSSGLSNAFSGTLNVNNVDEDFTGHDGIKYHIATKEQADAGTINIEGHANPNEVQGEWTFTTLAQAAGTTSTATAGGQLNTMTIYAVAGFAATLGATLFWYASKKKIPVPNAGAEKDQYTVITIDGLKKKYDINEPIEFAVSIKGYGNGVCPFISITKEPEGEKVWSQGYVTQEPKDSPPSDVDMNLKVPGNENPISIREQGLYTVQVSTTSNSLEESFEIV